MRARQIVVVGFEYADHAVGFGHAEILDEAAAEAIHAAQQQVGIDRGRAVVDVFQARKIARGAAFIVQHHAQHGRHGEQLGHALTADRLKHFARIDLRLNHTSRAAGEPLQRPASAADMEIGHGDDRDICGAPVGPEAAGADLDPAHRQRRPVADLHALGVAGGAAGIKLDENIVRADVDQGIGGLLAIAPRHVARVVKHDDLWERHPQSAQRRHGIREIGADEKAGRARIAQDMRDLARSEAPVDRQRDVPSFGTAEQNFEEPVVVPGEHCDALLACTPARQQSVGHCIAAQIERGVTGAPIPEKQREMVWPERGIAAQRVGLGRQRIVHRAKWRGHIRGIPF